DLQFSGAPALDARRPGGLSPPLGSGRPSRRSIARCCCGSSKMSCYGSSRRTRLPISAPGGSNEVVLGACPRINVIGSLNPALAYRFARPAGSRPLTSPGLCKGMVAPQHHGVLTRALSSPSTSLHHGLDRTQH